MRRASLTLSLLGAAWLLGACGAGDAERDETGAIATADTVEVTALRLGDCLETPADGEIFDLKAIPCGQAHDGEIFGVFELTDGDYPGDDAVLTMAEDGCFDRFEPFVGVSFDDSVLELIPLRPLEDGWGLGDREVQCIVQDPAGGLTATLEGATR